MGSIHSTEKDKRESLEPPELLEQVPGRSEVTNHHHYRPKPSAPCSRFFTFRLHLCLLTRHRLNLLLVLVFSFFFSIDLVPSYVRHLPVEIPSLRCQFTRIRFTLCLASAST